MATEETGQLVHGLLQELASCLELPAGRLPELFGVAPGTDYQQWLRAVKRAAFITSNEVAGSIGHFRCRPSFLILCSRVLEEFENESGWRALLNRLGHMYIESRIRGSSHWTTGSFRTMVDYARDAVGAPDAEAIAEALFEKHGIELHRPSAPASSEKSGPGHARAALLAYQAKVEAMENIIREAELLRARGASLEQVIGVIEPVLQGLCTPLVRSYKVGWEELEDTESFDEHGLVLVDQSDSTLVLLTDGRLAELQRYGNDERWTARMTFLSTQEALARYDQASCLESIIQALHRGCMRLLATSV